jgi:site-specific recombinase XerD
MVEGFLDAVANVQQLALRTQDRYRAALDRFLDYCQNTRIGAIDVVQETTVEEFVKWLRGQKRTRNGSAKGKKDVYKTGGIKFILSTCRTAFNWAARHRLLPPFAENPFTHFPIDQLKNPNAGAKKNAIFTNEQEKAFFQACNDWQRAIFTTLAGYGLRVGELTHLLIEDVDLENEAFVVRSKPWFFWHVKTGRERRLPLLADTREVFRKAVGGRKAGFVFLNEEYAQKKTPLAWTVPSPQAFRARVERTVADLLAVRPDANEREQKRAVVAFCRRMGQLPEKRVRGEFLKLTAVIGCPEFTRAHDLRHLFSSRAQAAGVNPLLVQEMLGHASLDMTWRYTHLDLDSMRQALRQVMPRASEATPSDLD